MSDRYLYVPSFALALGVSVALVSLRPSLARFAWFGLGGLAFVLVPLAFLRSLDFRSAEALWMGEVQAGNRALTVLENAAGVAESAQHYEDARDLRLLAARRYAELGFAAGFADLVAALRAQVESTGRTEPASFRGYEELLEQLLEGTPRVLSVPLPERPTLVFQIASAEARQYAAVHASSTRLELALLLASDGNPKADGWLEAGLALCPQCPPARVLAARVRLAQRDPARAQELISGPPVAAPELTAVIALQRALLAAATGPASAKARVLAAVLGESYPVACRELLDAARAAGATPVLAPDAERLICIAAGLASASSAHESKAVSELVRSSAARSRFANVLSH